MLKIAIICGGPSGERGISLNSARSFLDHTGSLSIDLTVLYVNLRGVYYLLTPAQLYSNTPLDFDYILAQKGNPLDEEKLVSLLQSMDLVFPLIHGAYGEGGTLQAFFEKHGIAFFGSSSTACRRVFNKYKASSFLKNNGFAYLPSVCMKHAKDSFDGFWQAHRLRSAVVKPTESGSSIGVSRVDSKRSARKAIERLFQEGFSEVLLEPVVVGVEFTICVLESFLDRKAVALIPLEIENRSGKIIDYRAKYLPSEQMRYHCPPRFKEDQIQKIREMAEKLFTLLEFRDCARIDGWVLESGEIRFSDFNPISGMEQNSFLFQQAAQVGLTHADLFRYILTNALKRYGKEGILCATSMS